MSNIIFLSKKITIQINTQKIQKTSGNLGNLYIDD